MTVVEPWAIAFKAKTVSGHSCGEGKTTEGGICLPSVMLHLR